MSYIVTPNPSIEISGVGSADAATLKAWGRVLAITAGVGAGVGALIGRSVKGAVIGATVVSIAGVALVFSVLENY